MNPEGEVSVVDGEAVGALEHGPVTPLRSLLRPSLAALVHDGAAHVLNVAQRHVGLVVVRDGHVVPGLHVGQELLADEEQGLSTYGALVVALPGDGRLALLIHVVLYQGEYDA